MPRTLVTLTLWPLSGSAGADVIDTSGQAPYERCGYCRGESGRGGAAIPRLAGQHPHYLRRQLAAFASGARANDDSAMAAASRPLSAGQIQGLSNYLSGLQRPVVMIC